MESSSLPSHRAQLAREKQAREDAERQKLEMEERLKQYEMESRRVQEGGLGCSPSNVPEGTRYQSNRTCLQLFTVFLPCTCTCS